MISNLLVKRGYLILSHKMNGEPKLTKMQKFSNKRLKDGMEKRIQKREFKVGEYVLLYNSHFRFFAGKPLDDPQVSGIYRSPFDK